MVDEQDRPVCTILAIAAQDTLAAIFNHYPTAGSAKSISAGINGVGEKIAHRRIDWKLPQQLVLSGAFGVGVWQRDLVCT